MTNEDDIFIMDAAGKIKDLGIHVRSDFKKSVSVLRLQREPRSTFLDRSVLWYRDEIFVTLFKGIPLDLLRETAFRIGTHCSKKVRTCREGATISHRGDWKLKEKTYGQRLNDLGFLSLEGRRIRDHLIEKFEAVCGLS